MVKLLAFFLLLILGPIIFIMFVVGTLVFGSPIFLQTRIGKGNKPFKLIKFRSFTIKSNEINVWGKWIRRLSLDEILQLINIIKGDMTFIGPRPLLPEYLPLYTDCQIKRHEVKPGITGLAQVNGRNKLNWEEQFELDVFYVENRSIHLNIKVLFKTFFLIFNSSSESHKIREPFNGEN